MACNMIDEYLAELERGLHGSRRARRAIVDEVSDGLREAVAQHCRAGMSLTEACAASVAEFGEPRVVASSFAPVVSARRVHRYGLGFVVMGPVMALLWITAALRGSFAAVPLPYTVAGIALIAVAGVVAASHTAAATAATGRAGRWISMGVERAARALLVSAAGVAFIDGSLLVILLSLSAESPHAVVALPALLGAAVSGVRICYAATSVIRLGPDRATA